MVAWEYATHCALITIDEGFEHRLADVIARSTLLWGLTKKDPSLDRQRFAEQIAEMVVERLRCETLTIRPISED